MKKLLITVLTAVLGVTACGIDRTDSMGNSSVRVISRDGDEYVTTYKEITEISDSLLSFIESSGFDSQTQSLPTLSEVTQVAMTTSAQKAITDIALKDLDYSPSEEEIEAHSTDLKEQFPEAAQSIEDGNEFWSLSLELNINQKILNNLLGEQVPCMSGISAGTEQELIDALTRIENGDNFDAVAQEINPAATAGSGTSLGCWSIDDADQSFQDLVGELEIGEISKPTLLDTSWWIVRVDSTTLDPQAWLKHILENPEQAEVHIDRSRWRWNEELASVDPVASATQ